MEARPTPLETQPHQNDAGQQGGDAPGRKTTEGEPELAVHRLQQHEIEGALLHVVDDPAEVGLQQAAREPIQEGVQPEDDQGLIPTPSPQGGLPGEEQREHKEASRQIPADGQTLQHQVELIFALRLQRTAPELQHGAEGAGASHAPIAP